MDNNNSHSAHVLPLSTYLTVGSVLLVLTVLTVYVATIDFGAYNLVIAMAIASFKASLVALIFMHLKYDSKLYSVVFLGALMFLAIFIVITMFDTLRRDDIYEIKGDPINSNADIYNETETVPIIDDSTTVMDSTVIDSTIVEDIETQSDSL